jgi:hypothetical protein
MKTTLPRAPRDRQKPSGRNPERPTKSREVIPPDIYVDLHRSSYDGPRYAKARIRFRRGCYAYLVWRDGETTLEYYLGKHKARAPRSIAAAPRPGAGRASIAAAPRPGAGRARSSSRSLRGTK